MNSKEIDQVLRSLPEELLLHVLRAAVASTPPAALQIEARHAHDCKFDPPTEAQDAMQALLSHLPPRLSQLVLQAHAPDGLAQGSFTMTIAALTAAAPITGALVQSYGQHLTSLSLLACSLRQLNSNYHKDWKRIRDGLQASFAPLAHLSALEWLHVGVRESKRTHFPDMATRALGAVLSHLTNLTTLRFKAHSSRGTIWHHLARPITGLPKLQTLDLAGRSQPPLTFFRYMLRSWTALTHLSLANRLLRDAGWAQFAPPIAALPLHTLEIHNCCLTCNCWELCPGEAQLYTGAPLLTSLRSLKLAGNKVMPISASTIRLVPHLTCLVLDSMRRKKGPKRAAQMEMLAALNDSADPPLEVLRLFPIYSGEGVARALSSLVERSRRLHTVTLLGAAPQTIAAALPGLARLQQLQEVELDSVEMGPDMAGCFTGSSLTRLRLSIVKYSTACGPVLINILATMPQLQSLSIGLLAAQHPDSDGGAVVVGGLLSLTMLTFLSMTFCGLPPEPTAELAGALKRLAGLRHLQMHDNNATKVGPTAAGIVCALPALRQLTFLSLDVASATDMDALVAVLPRMHGLQRIWTGNCGYGLDVHALLQAMPPGMQHVRYTEHSGQDGDDEEDVE